MCIYDIIKDYVSTKYKSKKVKIGKNFKKVIIVNSVKYHYNEKHFFLPKISEEVYVIFGFNDDIINEIIVKELG